MISVSTPCRNASTSNCPFGPANFIRFSEDRLHAESSRNMYSEHGFDALMRDVFEHGFQSLTVLSNCMPGSPQTHADWAILRISSRALKVSITRLRSVTARVCHAALFSYACMKSSVTRTEWFAFWNCTESYAPPCALNAPS